MLTLAFTDLRPNPVQAQVVATTLVSIRVLKKNNFWPIGRQRGCHGIDGQPYDRLLFDVPATERCPRRDREP
jgi:RimJ/RimL family protein N-acetyltransferase